MDRLVLVLVDLDKDRAGGGNGNPAETGLIVWAAAVFDGSVATEAIIDTLMSIMQSIMDSNAINNIHGRNPIREVVLARFKTACCV